MRELRGERDGKEDASSQRVGLAVCPCRAKGSSLFSLEHQIDDEEDRSDRLCGDDDRMPIRMCDSRSADRHLWPRAQGLVSGNASRRDGNVSLPAERFRPLRWLARHRLIAPPQCNRESAVGCLCDSGFADFIGHGHVVSAVGYRREEKGKGSSTHGVEWAVTPMPHGAARVPSGSSGRHGPRRRRGTGRPLRERVRRGQTGAACAAADAVTGSGWVPTTEGSERSEARTSGPRWAVKHVKT